MEDILDVREIVATSDDMLIKLAKVIGSADDTIFLGDNHNRHTPGGFVDIGKDPEFDLTVKFILESVAKSSWNGIRSIIMVRDCVRLEVNLELAFWIATERAI
jgi:hypothetical protein